MKIFKFLLVTALLSVVLYSGLSGVWAWQATLVLAQDALESPYEPLSDRQVTSLLKVEDEHFFSHQGIIFNTAQRRSTLTMAVADMVYFGGPQLRDLLGRGQSFFQQVRACCASFDISIYIRSLVLDWRLTKDEQLRIFTSNVYLGQFSGKPVFGFPSAALVYFETPVADLDESQWLTLVAMVRNPQKYHPQQGLVALQQRLLRIQRQLAGTCTPSSSMDAEWAHCDSEYELSNEQEPDEFY